MKTILPRLLSGLLLGLLLAGAAPAEGFRRAGIMVATEPELAPFLGALEEDRPEEIAGRTYHQGRLHGMDVVVVEGGVGKVNATLTATMLVSRFEVDVLFFSGVAAGLDDDLGIGDVVVSEQAVQVDYLKVASRRAYPIPIKRIDHDGRHRGIGVKPPRELVDAALRAGAGAELEAVLPGSGRPEVRPGVICTADTFVADSRHSKWVRRKFRGTVYEMEGAAMGQVARSFGVPWLVFRGVSDHSNGFSSVTYPFTRGRAAKNAARVVFRTLEALAR